MSTVTIIVPAFNEAGTIVEVLRQVRAQVVDGVEFRIIVVDDGSTDDTVVTLEENPQLYDRLIKQPANGGKGAAVLAALRAADGQYVLFQDADLEYSPSDYEALVYPVKTFGAEVVLGSRFSAPKYTRVQYFFHKVGNELITFIFNVMFNTTFTDIYTCYVLFKRDLIDPNELASRGWEQQAEILCRLVRRTSNIYEVPISYHGRSYEEGKKIRARHVFPVLAMIFRRRIFG